MPYNLTMLNGAAFGSSAPKFGSGYLSGGNGKAATPGPVVASPVFTWECWVRKSSAPGSLQVVLGAPDFGYIGILSDGKPRFNIKTGDATLDGATSVCDGAWHHLEMVGTNAGFKGYVDGVQVGSSNTANTAGGVSQAFYVGSLGDNGFVWTGETDEVATWSTSRHTANFTPTTSAYTGAEAGLLGLYHLDGNGTDSAGAAPPTTVAIAPNNAAVVYSPYNWNVQAGVATTINPGAYLRTFFTGASCVLNFDLAGLSGAYPQVEVRVDGGPWTASDVAATITAAIPSYASSRSRHLLEMRVKSANEAVARWTGASSVKFTGLTLPEGGAVYAPAKRPLRAVFFGDSITEGVRTLGEGNAPSFNHSALTYAAVIAEALNCEYGIVGFGATGFAATSSGVPIFATSLDSLYSGVARSWANAPDLIFINHGTNDGSINIVATATTALNKLLSASSTARIIVFRPFNGNQAANLQAAIAATTDPGRIIYIDTTGDFSTAYGSDSLNLHPTAENSLGRLGPLLLTKVQAAISQRYPLVMSVAATDMVVLERAGAPANVRADILKSYLAS